MCGKMPYIIVYMCIYIYTHIHTCVSKVITHINWAHTHIYIDMYVCLIFAALSRIDRNARARSLSLSPLLVVLGCVLQISTRLLNLPYISNGFLQHIKHLASLWLGLAAINGHQAAGSEVHGLAEMWFPECKRSWWSRDFQRNLFETDWRFQMFQPVGPPVLICSHCSLGSF